MGVFYLGPALIAARMLGLRARYGAEAGSLGKATLLIGAIGGAFALPLAFLAEWAATLAKVFADPEPFIVVFLGGAMLIFVCLVAFGVLALRRRPLPRWNGLPVVAGIPFPAAVLAGVVLTGLPSGFLGPDAVNVAGITATAVAFLMLGSCCRPIGAAKGQSPSQNRTTSSGAGQATVRPFYVM